MHTSRQELEYARELAALRRAKRGIGVAKDIGKSKYLKDGGNPNGPEEEGEEETVPEEEEPDMAAQFREVAREEAKRAAKEAAKEAAKKVAKKALLALLKNPYVLAAIGIIIGGILLIMLIVVIFQAPAEPAEPIKPIESWGPVIPKKAPEKPTE